MKKIFWSTMTFAFIFVAGIATVACTKENNKTSIVSSSKKMSSDSVLIGKLVGGKIVCGIDIDEFTNAMMDECGNYVVEHADIIDTLPQLPNGDATLYMILYNVEEEAVESYWLPLVKNNGDYLFANGYSNSNTIPYCVVREGNECSGTCTLKRDRDGRPVACDCKGAKGACDMKFKKDTTFWDRLGKAIENLSERISIRIDAIIHAII